MAEKIVGYLEVGLNGKNEVVINHPDENGVGHIIFSPLQARLLADKLLMHASTAEYNIRHKEKRKRVARSRGWQPGNSRS